jgi:hypothetical protein
MVWYDINYNCRNLTVLCPGMILETEDSFRLFSPPLEIQIKDDPSCHFKYKKINSKFQAYNA